MAERHKVVRSEELPIFVQEPFPGVESSYQFKMSPLWFELFGLIPQFWITEELLYVGHGNAALGHNMSCWQCGLGERVKCEKLYFATHRLRNPVLDS